MRESQTLQISYDGRISETTVFQKDETIATQNLEAANRLLDSLPKKGHTKESHVWSDVPAKTILAFLREYKTHPHAPKVNSALLSHYISKKSAEGDLIEWTVVLISSGDKDARASDKFRYPVNLIKRANETPEADSLKYSVKRLLSPSDEEYGLDDASINAALLETKAAWRARPADKRGKEEPKTPSGPALRKQRPLEQGLLLLYPLDSREAQLPYDDLPVVGVGISFPGDRLNPTDGVEYEANLVYVGRELGDDDYD